jgi:hypothetical protein
MAVLVMTGDRPYKYSYQLIRDTATKKPPSHLFVDVEGMEAR